MIDDLIIFFKYLIYLELKFMIRVQSKLILLTFILSLCSGIIISEEIQEIVILEKKLSSLNGWSDNQSITSISEKELDDLDAQHPKQIF